MSWPYTIKALSPEEKALRRDSISHFTTWAQLSIALPVISLAIYRIIAWATWNCLRQTGDARGSYNAVPSSPNLKKSRLTGSGRWSRLWRKLQWLLDSEVWIAGYGCGTWDQWVAGTVWTVWMLCLCVVGTGDDYLHLTKRFGSIAVSQFPLQYMLSLKAAAPLSIVCSSSHERINRFHRVLGRIIYLLLVCHGVLYLNYYMVTSKLKKLVSLVLLAGIGAMLLLTFLMLTSMASVRAYSYRIFFIIHLLAAFGVPLMLILHAGRHTAFFVAECLFVFVCDLIARKIGTFSAITSLKLLPGTNLIKIIVPVPENWKENFGRPGQHVYLSVPSPSRPHSLRLGLLFECLYNPFTIAKFDSDVNELTLVVRHRDGPMTEQLYQLVQAGSGHQSKAKGIKLSIEGPYGSLIPHFDRALNANRVLLVAGGVGATFILPIYVALKEHRTSESRVKFVWAVRQPSEATWAILSSSLDRKWPRSINTDRHSSRISPGESSGFPLQSSNSILDDNEVQLYLTGNLLSDMSSAENYIELSTINRGSNSSEWGNNNSRRPNLANMVNEIFRLGNEETIAIIVCGPRAMAREVRTAVTPWVAKGRDVFWHEESFGI